MSPIKINLSLKVNYFRCILLLSFLFCSTISHAQCAGTDAEITICDLTDPANQNINLFNLLGGSPTPGGSWIDIQQSGGLDTSTGILNATQINESDIYEFIYVVNDAGCAIDRATVTVTIGAYAGVGNPDASACSDNNAVNLFQFLGNDPNPQINGTWSRGGSNLASNLFDAFAAGPGVYTFVYTVDAIGTCPQSTATVILTVQRSPEPGATGNLVLCETDDMSIYTNVNLLDYITGQDPGGRWSETATSELSGPFDTFINVQNIFNTLGPGTYGFTYTVQPSHPICSRESATILIVIEEQLDFSTASLTVASDICENQIPTAVYIATIRQGVEAIPNGNYSIEYEVTGAFTSSGSVIGNAIAGNITFQIPNTSFPNIGTYTVKVINIRETVGFNACEHIIGNITDVVNVFPLPRINAGVLTITNACQSSSVPVELSGTTNLPDGNYQITFNLAGSNTTGSQTATFSVTSGVGTFLILGNLVPNVGNTTIRIIRIQNLDTGCQNAATLSQVFYVNPKPDTTNVTVSVNDFCHNQPALVNISGLGVLTGATITYSIVGANTATETITVTVTGGNASFTIPATAIPNSGPNVLTITGIANTVTLCGSNNLTITDTFIINALPSAPSASNQTFCSTENATVADLLPNGPNFRWYSSATSNSPLPTTTPLTAGNYWVSELSNSNCPSSRAMILLMINQIATPTLNTDGQNFCGLDVPAPTLADLSANVNFNGNLLWFDAATAGNQLSDSTILVDGFTYYGFDSSASGSCISENALVVTVSLTNCTDELGLMIPDGFSPNGDGINDTFKIPNIEFLFPNFTIEIYNRYGNLMYKGNRSTPNWDGMSNQSNANINGMAPNGVYFYIVNFNKDNKSPKQGRLYLNR